jgi:hypothetical protein
MALALVLCALALAVVIGLAFLTTASTSTPLAKTADERLQARLAAESGMAIAMSYLEHDPDWRANRPNGLWCAGQAVPGGTVDLYGEDGDQISAEGAVIGDGDLADDPADRVTLTAVATAGEARYRVRTTVTPALASTLAVSKRITVKGQALVDSYSSSSGAYGAGNQGSDTVISSNAVGGPHITLRNNARVDGNLMVGSGGDPWWAVQVLDSAAHNGTRGVLPGDVAMPIVTVPTMTSSGGSLSYSSGTNTVTGDLHCDDFVLNGDAVLLVDGDVRLLVDGDLDIDDSAVIEFGGSWVHGIATDSEITVFGSSSVDAYDSSAGAYGGGNAGLSATLATNEGTASAVSVTSATVVGDLYSGAGSDPSTAIDISGSASVTGRQDALDARVAIPPPPPWPSLGASSGPFSRNGGNYTMSTNMRVDSFRLTSDAVFRVNGHRTLRIDGDMSIEGQARLDIGSNASLKVYVGGSIRIAGRARVNGIAGDPTVLTIFGMTSGQSHDISGTASRVYAAIDAPGSEVRLSGNAQLYGAFMGGSIQVGGTSAFHHDRNPAMVTANPRMSVGNSRLTVHSRGGAAIGGSARLNPSTGDASRMVFRHLGDQPISFGDNSSSCATVVVPEMTCRIDGDARFDGSVKAHDLLFAGRSTVTAGGTAGDPGLLAMETIEVRDSAQLTATGGTMLLASNAVSTISISVEDSAVVQGNAFSGPGGNAATEIQVAGGAQITGTKSNLPTSVAIALPSFPPPGPSPADYICDGSRTVTLSNDLECNNLLISDDAVLEVTGEVNIVAAGAVRISDRGKIVLGAGAKLAIYCYGDLEMTGDAAANAGAEPRRLLVNLGGSRADLRDRADLCGTVVAPSALLTVQGTANMSGSALTERITVRDQAQVHYDRPTAPSAIAWIEQQ